MEAIDCPLETRAHLNLINKQKVLSAFPPVFFYISEQLMILKQSLELIEVVVDVNHVRVRQSGLYEIAKRLEQFRFSATANACDDLDIRHADKTRQGIHIRRSIDEFHRHPPLGNYRYSSKLKIF